jgi:hypothetical protein
MEFQSFSFANSIFLLLMENWETLQFFVNRILTTSSISHSDFITCYSIIFNLSTTQDQHYIHDKLYHSVLDHLSLLQLQHGQDISCHRVCFLNSAKLLNHCFRHLCSTSPGMLPKTKVDAVYCMCLEIWDQMGGFHTHRDIHTVMNGISELQMQ